MKTTKQNELMKRGHIWQNILKAICGSAVFVLLFTTCEVGLGGSVDVLPPELAISYPSPAEKVIIRGEFKMKGTVSDDAAVASVQIGFAGKENAIQYKYGPYPALLSTTDNTWSLTLNTSTLDAAANVIYPIKDAEYTVTITAYDEVGRATAVAVDYEIDNTAPVVIMAQPGSADVLTPENYGTKLNITGQAEDTNINELVFTSFDEDRANPREVRINLGGSQAIKSLIGEFQNELNDHFYDKIYGEGTIKKDFFYTVWASDKAKEFNDPDMGTGTGIGNISEVYYLFDETKGIVTAETLHSINTGLFYTNIDSTVDEAKKTEADAILVQLVTVIDGETHTPTIEVNDPSTTTLRAGEAPAPRLGTFALLPSKFPTYSLNAVPAVTEVDFDKVKDENKISATASLFVEVSPNNDGVSLDLDTLTIRALKLVVVSGKVTVDTYSDAYRLHPLPDAAKYTPARGSLGKWTYKLLEEGNPTVVKDTSFDPANFALDPNLPPKTDGTGTTLPLGSYIIDVTGKDIDGNVFNIGDTYYGFTIEGSNTPPALKVDEINSIAPTSTTVQVKGGEAVEFKGTVQSFVNDTGVPKIESISYTLKNADGTITLVGNEKVTHVATANPDIFSWDFNLTSANFGLPGESGTYVLEIEATDGGTRRTTVQYAIYYDVKSPVFAKADLSHTVVNNSLPDGILNNKTITVRGTSADDDKLAEKGAYVLQLKNTDGTIAKTNSSVVINSPGNFSFSFDTKDIANADGSIADGNTLEVEVTITDRVGNSTTQTIVFDNEAPTLTNARVLAPATPSFTDPTTNNWYKDRVLEVGITARDVAPAGADVSGITWVELRNGLTGAWTKMLQTGRDEWTGSVSFTEKGLGTVYFRAADTSLNVVNLGTPLPVHIDFDSPTALNLVTVDGNAVETLLTDGQKDIIVNVNGASDGTGSGVKSVRLLRIGATTFEDRTDESDPLQSIHTHTAAVSITSATDTAITIAEEQAKAGTDGAVVFRLTDKVGNEADFTLFTLNIDDTPPTAVINDPAQNAEVNGIITIRGTAGDDRQLTKVVLEGKGAGLTTEWATLGGTVDGLYSWTTEFTPTLDGSILIRAKVTDVAGNIGLSDERSLKVIQDSDRPIVTVTNLDLKGMSLDANVWLRSSNTLLGIVNDDDGVIQDFEISTDGGMNYGAPTSWSGGSWSHDILADGGANIFFKVTTADGAIFTSRALGSNDTGLQTSPKLTDGTNFYGYTGSGDKGSSINVNVDTEPPAITTTIHIDTSPSGTANDWFDDADDTDADIAGLTLLTTNMPLGGTISTFSLRIQVADANGIESVTILNGDDVLAVAVKKGDTNVFITPIIDTKKLLSGYVELSIKATDNAGVKTTIARQILVDNVAPVITEITAPADKEQVTGVVEISGTATDDIPAAGLASIEYIIPTTNTTASWVQPDDTSAWKEITGSALAWKIKFDEDNTLSSYVDATGTQHGIETGKGTGVWRLPIVFRLEDKVGNVTITGVESYVLHIDPNGDKPKVAVSYPLHTPPDNFITLGGAIRIFGTAEDNEVVKAVYIQIDTDGDADFDDVDKTFLKGKDYTIEDIKPSDKPGSDPADWWGIKVNGRNSWNTTINAKGEFNPADGATAKISYRVRSVDGENAVSEWSPTVNIRVDKNNPKIGNTDPLKLVQYATGNSGTIVAEQTYIADMWVKGEWYLTGSIEDESDIVAISVTGDLSATQSDTDLFTKVNMPYKGYSMNIPLGSANANISFTIVVLDGSDSNPGTVAQTISVNRDNVAPTSDAALESGGLEINADGNTVQQSNKTFTFNSTAVESGSGFSHIAFWFERDVNGDTTDRIYNVMEDKASDGNRTTLTRTNPVPDGTVGMIDGLPRLNLTGVTRTAEDTLTHSSINNNENVRKGGLVKIGGVDRFITDVSGSTITFTPGVDVTHKTAAIAYVMVVNNQTIETLLVNGTIANDDGDGMVESVERSGGNYAWAASIDSRNIPDGPIKIQYVAFDVAGNASALKTVESKVENNKPAIAKVWLGTDSNGNGSIENALTNDGETWGYSTLNESDEAVNEAIVNALGATGGSPKFTAKGLTHVTPEIVGGNGDLFYSLTVENVTVNVEGDNTRIRTGNGGDVANKTEPIVLSLTGERLLGLEDTTVGGIDTPAGRVFNFSIWDSTEETTPGTDSQKATLELSMHVDAVDEVKPLSVISPFYWNSETDNSVYTTKRVNGHIELEDDLPVDFTSSASSGVNDRDPKVSGKVSIRGTAYDDRALNEIWAKIDGFTFTNFITDDSGASVGLVKLATYNPTTANWAVGAGTIADDGWAFTIENTAFGQDGHSVEWQLDWDSQKLTDVVGLDKTLTILSRDKTGNFALDTNVTGNKPEYQMDIVPYIRSVTTKLSNIDGTNPTTNSRTALGRYPVYEREEITITGFNMKKLENPVLNIGGSTKGVSFLDATLGLLKVDIGPDVESGSVFITVGGVASLNNINSNVPGYNKTPNGANNNNLVDDVMFDVWENVKVASPRGAKILYPELRIRPNDGLVGLAFVNGNYYFNMPGADAEGNNFKSQRPIERGYAPYFESALAFDPQGNVFGLSTNEDAGDKYSSFTTFYFDRLGNKGTGNDANDPTNSASNYRGGAYRRRLMSTTSSASPLLDTEIKRVVSPSMAATLANPDAARSNRNRSNVYLAYYDEISKEVRYQWATIGSTLEKNNANSSLTRSSGTFTLKGHGFTDGEQVTFTGVDGTYNPAWNKVYYIRNSNTDTFDVAETPGGETVNVPIGNINTLSVSAIGGQIMDIAGGLTTTSDYVGGSATAIKDIDGKNYSVIASMGQAGSHVSLDARSNVGMYDPITNPARDLVVITWYNNATRTLMYAYNATSPQSDDNGWTTKEIDSVAGGWYNSVKIDSNGGVHIAYYGITGADLKYVKLAKYDDSPVPTTVDSYQIAGTQIRLDVAKSGTNQVPYISYYAAATQTAKLAYQVNFGVTAAAGALADKFTGNWEVSHVPSPNAPRDDTINVGVHKDPTSGNLELIPSVLTSPNIQSDTDMGNSTYTSNVGGNGSTNPVVAYVIDTDSSLEMAQKKNY